MISKTFKNQVPSEVRINLYNFFKSCDTLYSTSFKKNSTT